MITDCWAKTFGIGFRGARFLNIRSTWERPARSIQQPPRNQTRARKVRTESMIQWVPESIASRVALGPPASRKRLVLLLAPMTVRMPQSPLSPRTPAGTREDPASSMPPGLHSSCSSVRQLADHSRFVSGTARSRDPRIRRRPSLSSSTTPELSGGCCALHSSFPSAAPS